MLVVKRFSYQNIIVHIFSVEIVEGRQLAGRRIDAEQVGQVFEVERDDAVVAGIRVARRHSEKRLVWRDVFRHLKV